MKKQDVRIVFMGTPEFAVASLRTLVENGYHVVGVVTAPDRTLGRHQSILQASPVKRYALSRNLPILQPENLKDTVFINRLIQWHADLQIVVAFRMLPEAIWSLPHLGTCNLHASLLPQYRGAAPIHWAIIRGEKETGVTVFFIGHAIDAGKIIAQKRIPIEEVDTVGTLHDKLMILGAKLVLQTVDNLLQNKIVLVEQIDIEPDEIKLKLAPKIFKATCRINWNQSVRDIRHFVRGLCPFPGAWTELILSQETLSLKILETELSDRTFSLTSVGNIMSDKKCVIDVSARDGWIRVKTLQLMGKKRMSAKEFLMGNAHLLSTDRYFS